MKVTATITALRLLLWSGFVLVFFAVAGDVSAHEVIPSQQGTTVLVYSAPEIGHDADRDKHQSTNDQNCVYHSGAGCGAQWAFLAAGSVLPIVRPIAWASFAHIIHAGGATNPLDHPPKFRPIR